MSGSEEQQVPTESAVAETPATEPVPVTAEAKKPAEKGTEKTAAEPETKPEKKGRRRRRRNRKKGKKDAKDDKGEKADASDGSSEKEKDSKDYVLQPVKKKKSPATRRKNKNAAGGRGGQAARGPRGRRRGGRGYNYHGPPRGGYPPYMFPPHPGMGPGWGMPPQQHYLPCDYEAVKRQLEFYFGEINLARDQFIRSHMDRQGFVPAYVMAGFPRMRNGMITPGEILHAASRSPLLDVRNGCIRSKRLWKRFAGAEAQERAIQSLNKGPGVGDEVRPQGDDIPEGFGDQKCVVKKKLDNGRKALIARADDPERCVIVLTGQLSAWSLDKKAAPKAAASKAAPAKDAPSDSPTKADGDDDQAEASKQE